MLEINESASTHPIIRPSILFIRPLNYLTNSLSLHQHTLLFDRPSYLFDHLTT